MNVSLQEKKKREAVSNTANRLEKVETAATTTANHKNTHGYADKHRSMQCVSGSSALLKKVFIQRNAINILRQ